MPDRIVFAHPPEVRKKAKDALVKHGSLRKAAAAVGLPKSTLHYWQQKGGFDSLDDLLPILDKRDPSLKTDAPETVEQVLDDADTGDYEPAQPTGYPETPIDATKNIHNAPVDGWPIDRDRGFALLLPNGTQQWDPDSPRALKALLRYSNSLIAGADPENALRAARIIDPEFAPSEEQHTRLLTSLSTLMMGERKLLMAAINPPPYVRDTYDKFAWNQDDVDALSGFLQGVYADAYKQAINDQLAQIGRGPIDAVTDPSLLAQLSNKAGGAAQAIADTWNRDLANHVGQSWIDLSATEGTQMSRVKLEDAVNDWEDARSTYKAEQWAKDAASQTDGEALQAWRDNNGTITMGMFVGDDTAELVCADMLDQYGDWTPIDEIPDFGVIPHANCIHGWDTQQADVPDDQPLWTGE